ncbi:Rho termination factor [Sphingobacterium sp. SRCM116780]|uniref:DUF7218 family protein n=1 Tax=Sphingobacterium sp. SRCM116780 TaxID=2907623 RepID=UPI001F37CB31|nr:Rho termination factor [Sphingobacterium sp. SRCM116780]UIR57275.1 Rho termination factor [Sphingobacterium sp. SRCM116780]
MEKKHGNQLKDDAKYEALRQAGNSKEKSARIANTPDSEKHNSKDKLEDRAKASLLKEAKTIGIIGRQKMTKEKLITAIREH